VDNTSTNAAETMALAQQLVTVLAGSDPEKRRRAVAAAMALLGDAAPPPPQSQAAQPTDKPVVDVAAFFSREDGLRPSANAYLCAAYHYAMYGTAAFSLEDLRSIAGEAGVVLPDRLDMTLKQAGKRGKRLFQSTGKDSYKPTAVAGMIFKERWGVVPGRLEKPERADG
jgi:hypothetical protein